MGLDGSLVPSEVTVMGPPSIDDLQLVGWFMPRAPFARLTVSPGQLVRMFLQEGYAEGVRGDVAFCQSCVETGWFQYGGGVQWGDNNYAGLGAVDSNPGGRVQFPDARVGVRAQIQHLRRYADPTCTDETALHYPLVDNRFALVRPPGRAPLWNQFGFGVWASSRRTDPTYAESILGLFAEALRYRDAHPS